MGMYCGIHQELCDGPHKEYPQGSHAAVGVLPKVTQKLPTRGSYIFLAEDWSHLRDPQLQSYSAAGRGRPSPPGKYAIASKKNENKERLSGVEWWRSERYKDRQRKSTQAPNWWGKYKVAMLK